MTPRLVAAFFLMLFGAGVCTLDLTAGDQQVDWHLGVGAGMMFVGAVFTDPAQLVPAFKTTLDAIAQFIPFTSARARRKSGQVKAIEEEKDA